MRLKNLALKDKGIFVKYLNLTPHRLSVYNFNNIYIWKGLFEIKWAIIENNLCLFFEDKIGAFLYLTPLGMNRNINVIKEVFSILDKINKNKPVSRIENIEQQDLAVYERGGYKISKKSDDYVYRRSDLANFKGNKFKSQRAGFNYFSKNYKFQYLPLSPKDRQGCLELYGCWMDERKSRNPDHTYQGMLTDSRNSLTIALKNYTDLDFSGRIVKINHKIRGFTIGFRLNNHTFCILYEITDLAIKGLSQFIFRQFCRELSAYEYINVMDDSGLENLKKVKLAYHPAELVPAYIAKR